VSLEVWLTFAIASSVLLLIPGPTILTVVSYALSRGTRSKRQTIPGVVLGDFTAMTISILGAGAIIAASAMLFTALKIVGALYLVWMGLQLWRSGGVTAETTESTRTVSDVGMFWNCYLVTALNPKSIVFFIAFLPQFVSANAPILPQLVILELTFLTLATISLLVWDGLAIKTRSGVHRPSALRIINRAGGGFLVAAGLIAASSSRSG
jgi:threonine/homoserine/homoserine lactone efflux protein